MLSRNFQNQDNLTIKLTMDDRIILLMDVDCFEVQVYQRLPEYRSYRGKPCVVTNSAGIIVSVSNEAKESGVSRKDLNYHRARAKCPGLKNIRIPEREDNPGRPDYTFARQATNEIVDEIKKTLRWIDGLEDTDDEETATCATTPVFHYSSHDEFFLDVTLLVNAIMLTQGNQFPTNIKDLWTKSIVETPTEPVPARDWTSNSLYEIKLFYGLGIGSMILERIRDHVGYQVSVGVGSNKLTAKLACGLNKPAAVTLILPYSIIQVGKRIKLDDVPSLGGKFGDAIKKELKIKTMYDLSCYRVETIANIKFNSGTIGREKGQEFFNSVRGICNEEVIEKWASSSMMTSILCRGGRGQKYSFDKLSEELRNMIKTIQERAQEEVKWRQRVPLSLKLIIRRLNRSTLSARLDYPIEAQNADEVLYMFVKHMSLDDIWDQEGEPVTVTKLELQAQPFFDVDVEYE